MITKETKKETILVNAQYEENYDYDNGNFRWKKKGSETFVIEMDENILLNSNPSEVFAKMLTSYCNAEVRYTYISHEVQFIKPKTLGTEEQYLEIQEEIDFDKKFLSIEGDFRMNF